MEFMNDEETFNHALADVLRDKIPHLLRSEPLRTLRGGGRPDILVLDTEGNPVVVETEFVPAVTVDNDAQLRLGRLLTSGRKIEHVIALSAPGNLRTIEQTKLRQEVAKSSYQYCLFTTDLDEIAPLRWPTKGKINGTVNNLADMIETCLVSEIEIRRAQTLLEEGISEAAELFDVLSRDKVDSRKSVANALHQEYCTQTARMAMAIVANALTFHLMIAGSIPQVSNSKHTRKIPNFDEMRAHHGMLQKRHLLRVWNEITTNINYDSIFKIAKSIITPFPDNVATKILELLANVAQDLTSSGVTRSHDLSGRVFQRLITDRKFLATYYTTPTAATLLSELAVGSNWSRGGGGAKLPI